MTELPDDICPAPLEIPRGPTRPLAPPIVPSSVYACDDPEQAEALLAGEFPGYVYSRDGHPNADLLAEKCRQLHGADQALICGSGMSALALVLVAHCQAGDQAVVSRQLYGRTLRLWREEAARFGVRTTVIEPTDLPAVEQALAGGARLLLVETIANPTLRVVDLAALARLCAQHGALLVVDNTLAGPVVCRPLDSGAVLVVESLTKIINGHSDVLLGCVCGKSAAWERMKSAHATWGFSASPFDCWLAARGLSTLALRSQRAASNALAAARFLTTQSAVSHVAYPGLPDHPDHALARGQFMNSFSYMVTFDLRDGRTAAESFIRAARRIPFCPSLGDLSTTLSHPESTSHRTITAEERAALGIAGGTIRLSVGIESESAVIAALAEGLAGV